MNEGGYRTLRYSGTEWKEKILWKEMFMIFGEVIYDPDRRCRKSGASRKELVIGRENGFCGCFKKGWNIWSGMDW